MSIFSTQHPEMSVPPEDLFAAAASIHHGRRAAELHLNGDLCAFTEPGLRNLIEGLLGDGVESIVVDLTQLTLCTSDGADLFDRTRQRLESDGGRLVLVGARGVVQRVLDIVGLDHETG